MFDVLLVRTFWDANQRAISVKNYIPCCTSDI